jgi:5'-AMP-activated protein kinase catalytic alpha subunit
VNSRRKQLLSTACGTPNYIAPEVIGEYKYDGMKSDIWSCGVILFVMLAGYLPFDDDYVDYLFRKIEKGKFKMPKHFSPEAKDLISKILRTKPSKRLTIAQIKKHPWFKV